MTTEQSLQTQKSYEHVGETFASLLADALGSEVSKVILYGSVARGEAREESDIDVVVVGPDIERNRDRISDIRNELDLEHGTLTSLILLTDAQFQNLSVDEPAFHHELMSDGRILLDRRPASQAR